jgi:hypothetical protein
MKIENNTFHEYLNKLNKMNLHTKYEKIYTRLPQKIEDFQNILLFGPKGIGKYSQALKIIQRYSPSKLNYEKKIIITNNKKQNYYFKISDIHYEIDMSLLGCNSRQLWNDFYQQILDIIMVKENKSGIILCKNIQNIDRELLEILYYYMNDEITRNVKLKFVFITEQVSFIPNSLLELFNVITMNRPKKTDYNKLLKNSNSNNIIAHASELKNITNIKNIELNIEQMRNPEELMCNILINQIINKDTLDIIELRNNLYNLLIYHLNIEECIWFILKDLYYKKLLTYSTFAKLNEQTYKFLKYYNNNYRPIFHLEKYFLYIIKLVHEL